MSRTLRLASTAAASSAPYAVVLEKGPRLFFIRGMRRALVGGIMLVVERDDPPGEREEGRPNLMDENNSSGLEREQEPPTSIEYPVVRKNFRVTIDVEATLTGGPRGGELPPAPENVPYTRALMERLEAQPELVDRLLRYRAMDAAKQAVKALEIEHREGGASVDELLGPIIAELAPDAQAYFTEWMEDGVSVYYFDGYGATVERVSISEISEEE